METFSTPANRNPGKSRVILAASAVIILLLAGYALVMAYLNSRSGSETLTYDLAQPLGEVIAAEINIDNGDGDLIIDHLTGGEPLLAGGALQYLEGQGPPDFSLSSMGDQASYSLKAKTKGQPSGLRLPWEACYGETEWNVHLNPGVKTALTAHSGGGNLNFNLAALAITRLAADTGGGNIEVALPRQANELDATLRTGGGNVMVEVGDDLTGENSLRAESGAGNVEIYLPGGLPARITVSTGLGKISVDPRFIQVGENTYQSADYEGAAARVEITAGSGAGNVSIYTK